MAGIRHLFGSGNGQRCQVFLKITKNNCSHLDGGFKGRGNGAPCLFIAVGQDGFVMIYRRRLAARLMAFRPTSRVALRIKPTLAFGENSRIGFDKFLFNASLRFCSI
jgi:hypothetical protein